jgi:hypothetical protein
LQAAVDISIMEAAEAVLVEFFILLETPPQELIL